MLTRELPAITRDEHWIDAVTTVCVDSLLILEGVANAR